MSAKCPKTDCRYWHKSMLPHCEEGACPCVGCEPPTFGRFVMSAGDSKPEPTHRNEYERVAWENAQLKREVERLRESEAKAWGLVELVLREWNGWEHAEARGLDGAVEFEKVLVSIDGHLQSRAALAARRAGS